MLCLKSKAIAKKKQQPELSRDTKPNLTLSTNNYTAILYLQLAWALLLNQCGYIQDRTIGIHMLKISAFFCFPFLLYPAKKKKKKIKGKKNASHPNNQVCLSL